MRFVYGMLDLIIVCFFLVVGGELCSSCYRYELDAGSDDVIPVAFNKYLNLILNAYNQICIKE